jgi:hypothetical protein
VLRMKVDLALMTTPMGVHVQSPCSLMSSLEPPHYLNHQDQLAPFKS